MVLVKVHCVDKSVNWGLLKELSVCSGPCKGSLYGHIGKLGAFEGVV